MSTTHATHADPAEILRTLATAGQVFTGSLAADAWEPFVFMQDGAEHRYGEVVMFRSIGATGHVLGVGLWRAPDGTTPIYTSESGDETFLVLDGEAEIEFLDLGERRRFGPGDICAWSRHSRTRWHLRGSFRKFFVVAGG